MRFFFIAAILLLSIRDAQAEQLYQQNLLRSAGKATVESNANKQTAEWALNLAKASEKARCGNLVEALNELSKLISSYPEETDLSQVFAERAEVKSLLGFTNAALEDCDRACIFENSSKFLHLWHRWMILDRAGRTVEAERALQAADRDARRQFLAESSPYASYASYVKQLAEKHCTALLKPNEQMSKKLLAAIKNLSECETPPSIEELRDLYDIPLDGSQAKSFDCTDCSGSKFWDFANAASDMTILRLRVNTDLCAVSKNDVSNLFDLALEQNGSFTANRKGKLQGLQFGFDADRLRFIGFYWKSPGLTQSNQSIK